MYYPIVLNLVVYHLSDEFKPLELNFFHSIIKLFMSKIINQI